MYENASNFFQLRQKEKTTQTHRVMIEVAEQRQVLCLLKHVRIDSIHCYLMRSPTKLLSWDDVRSRVASVMLSRIALLQLRAADGPHNYMYCLSITQFQQ